ncbi:MAG TPA: rRNA maturation RNase YbeY [Gemmatimonadaceae bacterium]|nr:rRNA maturation RNase YbeY [Gemmatimonadaceae bacterium]
MSHVVVVDTDGVRVPLSRQRVAAIARIVLSAERIAAAQLSITFVNNRRIAALNRRHLNHGGSTDVISFGLASVPRAGIVGDIYIAPDVARRNAVAHGVSVREELTRLVVHGVLHVLGFDHPDGNSRNRSPMWRRQEQLVARLTRRTRSAA